MRRLLHTSPGWWDLPELRQIGSPLEHNGAVAESQIRAADAIGADRCWFGVNGATGLLQTALLAMTTPGDAVLMPRNCHKSLIQTCVLGDLTPVLFDLPYKHDRGHADALTASWLQTVLKSITEATPTITAAVLVHPTYQGYASQPDELINLLHQQGWAVLVDEAHGSHFATDVDPNLPKSSLRSGADLVVHSLHKSATGLTQTAVLWHQGNRIDPAWIERSLGWLQTTSPSALLLASCECALQEWFSQTGRNQLRRRLVQARALQNQLRDDGLPILSTDDPLKLVLHTGTIGVTGLNADSWMLQHGVAAELPEPATLTFCLGYGTRRGLRRRFKKQWDAMKAKLGQEQPLPLIPSPPIPKLSWPSEKLSNAWRCRSELVRFDHAEGRIAAELVCPYPPGIPLVVPGEKLDLKRIQWMQYQKQLWGEQIQSQFKVMPIEVTN
ncbi:aminotransferase class I/II-fold pyridoxal phosphate-dependent enzyme [Synechococcus sp. M16CYN]